jgi:hypothetical protein
MPRVVISVVVDGPAADGLLAVEKDSKRLAWRLASPIEEMVYRTLPSSVSRTVLKRGMRVAVAYLKGEA